VDSVPEIRSLVRFACSARLLPPARVLAAGRAPSSACLRSVIPLQLAGVSLRIAVSIRFRSNSYLGRQRLPSRSVGFKNSSALSLLSK